MGVGKIGLAGLRIERARSIGQRQHRLPQGFGLGDAIRSDLAPEQIGHQQTRRNGFHRPVRHQQGPRSGIEEGPPQARYRFRAGPVPRGRIAGGEYHPIGIQLQRQHLVHGQETVAGAGYDLRRRQRQRRLG
jgi:hypothetical protein